MRGAFRFLLSVSCAAFLSAVVSCTGTKEPAAVPPEKTKTVEPVKTQPKAEPVKPDQQPKKEAEPQVVAQPVPDTPTDAPAQYFFPHGHRGQIIAYDKFLVLAASWTRGDGIAFFDISDPKHPFYAYGLPSAGYIGDVVRRGDVLYFATGYSIQTVKMPFRKTILKKITHDDDCRPHILENTLIAFPGGNVRRLALSKDSLYVTAPDGLRKYTLAKDGRPEYSHTYRELKQLSAFAISGNNLYFVRSSMKNNVYRSSLANPEKTEAVRVAKAPVEKLITAPDGQAFMFAGKKLMRCDMRDEVFPGKIIQNVQQVTETTFAVRYTDGETDRLVMTDGVALYRDLTAEGLPAAARPADLDNDRTWVWSTDKDLFVRQMSAIGSPAVGKLPHVVRHEAPVALCGNYVYSVDLCGSEYILYGYRIDQEQPADRMYDVVAIWKTTSKKPFRYDIVIPAFSFYRYGKYLFAPEAVLDVSKPVFPEVVGRINGTACSVAEGPDGILYLAQGHKLTVLNAKKLPYLDVIAEIPADQNVKTWTDIAADEGHLYLNARNSLIVFSLKDPAKPERVAELPLPGQSYKIIRIGKMLYLPPYGGQNTPFRIIDVSRPNSPRIVGIIPGFEGHSILGVAERNGKLYVADGIRIKRFSLKDPAKPQLEQTWSGPDLAMQGYSWIDVQNGFLAGKKYPRFDVWRITE